MKEDRAAKKRNPKNLAMNKFKSDTEIDTEIQDMIEMMTQQKEKRKILNNPPQKESHLKGSKDNDEQSKVVTKYALGVFGGI